MKMPGIDSRIRAVCGLAPASEPFVGRKAFAPGELPFSSALPSLLIAGLADVLVDIDTSVRPLFERMTDPCALIGMEAVDHFHFCDNVPLLHGLHEKNRRPAQTRETLAYPDTLPEARTHRAVCALVTSFFRSAFAKSSGQPIAQWSPEALTALDKALRRT
jgi:hypothetical protein